MNHRIIITPVIILTLLTLNINLPICAMEEVGAEHSGNIMVVTHVNILPMDEERILEDYSVVIIDGKIENLGPSSTLIVPSEAEVINAKGKYLIPSLSDMHIHLEGDAWNIMYPPGKGYSPEEINYEDILFMYIAKGITTVQVMSAFPEHIAIRDSINRNEMLGPRLVLSRMIDGAGKAWPPPISTWVNNAGEARKAVLDAYETGYDRIKVYSFLDRASYDTIMQTATLLKMPVDGHIPHSISIDHLISSGQKMIAHSEEFMNFTEDYSQEYILSLSSSLEVGNVWLTPTLITSHNLTRLLENPEKELTKKGVEHLHPMGVDLGNYIYENLYKPIPESRQQYIKTGYETFQVPFVNAFHSMGGKLLTGSDVLIPPNQPGYSLHEELEELVNAGLTPYEALRASTTNPHEFLDESDQAGTIEPGKMASLVLLSSNPLENISNTRGIEGVIYKGRWIPRDEIDSRLEKIAASYTDLSNIKKGEQ